MSEVITTFGELSKESSGITSSLTTLREISASVKTGYSEMLTMTDNLKNDMKELALAARK